MDYGDKRTCASDEWITTDSAASVEACQMLCMNSDICTHIYYRVDGKCALYSSCAKLTDATTDGDLYTISDAAFDLKAKLTFVKTGCPNTQVGTSWWQMVSVQPERVKARCGTICTRTAPWSNPAP